MGSILTAQQSFWVPARSRYRDRLQD